jgi:hypothetical protein
MKVNELTELNFNTQAELARSVCDSLRQKFGFEARIQLYDHAGSEKHKGSGNISVMLKKKNDRADAEFLGDVILPWLRDNLAKLMKRPISNVTRGRTWEQDKCTDITFSFNFKL